MRLEFLDLLANSQSVPLKSFMDLGHNPSDTAAVLRNMLQEGLISGDRNGPFRIEPLGREARLKLQKQAEDLEKEHQQEAKAERQQRFDNKIAVANLLVSAVSFIVGLLVEHYSGIVGLVSRIFG